MTTYAVYGLEPIGVDGALEAASEVRLFCSLDCARNITEPTATTYSTPEPTTDSDNQGFVCEWCCKLLTGESE